MNKFVFCVLSPLLALTVPVHADESTGAPDFLFVQSAAGMTVDGDTLTLNGVNPTVVFFSDRPQRIAGHVRLSGFLQLWDEGKDSFAADPPNANLSLLGDNVVSNTVVELSNPRMSSDDLVYDVKVLDGSWPGHDGEVALFIDGLFTGGALKSGARGGVIGAIGGAIGGDAGKGAAIGAGIGVVGGLIHDSKE
jgi:hypothetical protein